MNPPRFSVVIPAHNEQFELPRTLAAFDVARDHYAGQGGAGSFEFIVVDNLSTDATAEIARAWGARVVREEERQIARVRNTGVRAASGDIVVTCDADSAPHPGIFVSVDRLMRGNTFAGGVRIWAEDIRASWYLPFLMVNAASVVMRLPCGMFFLRREDYLALGGFDENLYALEDVEFARRLRKEARRRGMRIATLTNRPILTSTRKLRLRRGSELIRWFTLGLLRPRKYLTRREYWDAIYYGPGLRDKHEPSS
ncbi:glycosyltransferase [candidate division KSB1 bacterium]|nr:glycosyltransferase [candidate division KSB1 bacterium]